MRALERRGRGPRRHFTKDEGTSNGTLTSAGKVPNRLGFMVREKPGVIGVLVIWWWCGGGQGSPTDPQAGDRVDLVDLGSIGTGYRPYKRGGSGCRVCVVWFTW